MDKKRYNLVNKQFDKVRVTVNGRTLCAFPKHLIHNEKYFKVYGANSDQYVLSLISSDDLDQEIERLETELKAITDHIKDTKGLYKLRCPHCMMYSCIRDITYIQTMHYVSCNSKEQEYYEKNSKFICPLCTSECMVPGELDTKMKSLKYYFKNIIKREE